MNTKRFYLLIFLATFTAVAYSQDSTSTNEITGPENVQFYAEFINSIPNIIDFKTQCEVDLSRMSAEQRSTNRPFTPAGYELLGKFLISNNYNVILCTSINVSLLKIVITDKEGSTLSDKEIKITDCSTTVEINVESKNALVLIVSRKGKIKNKSLRLSDTGEIK